MLQRIITTIDAAAWTISVHLLVGGLLWTACARSVGSRRCAHSLRKFWPIALGGVLVSMLGWWLLGEPLGELLDPVGLSVPGAFTLIGSIATSGCYLVLHAARLEARGALRPARIQVRLGGKTAFLAIDGLLILLLVSSIIVAVTRRGSLVPIGASTVVVVLAGATLAGTAGLVALLAGLSGKPRPSGYFAAALYVTGLLLLVGAADPR
jgi:hypothetical protein